MAAGWDRRTVEDQARVRSLVLENWIRSVAASSEFWDAYLRRVGAEADRIRSLERLRDVPTVRERDLVGAGGPGSPALVLRPSEDEVKASASIATLWQIATSIFRAGPTGKRRTILTDYKPVHLHADGVDGGLTVAYSRADLDRLHRAGARAASVLGLDATDHLVSAVPASDRLTFWGVYHLALGSSMLAAHPRGAAEPIERVVRAFRRVPATAVAVPAGEALDLAKVLVRAGQDLSRVRTVITVGPPLAPGDRAEVADAWRAAGATGGVSVLALWAPPGARALWAECSETTDGRGSGLHTYPDMEIVELVDPAGRPVRSGGGDLTLTSIGWNGTALVRFQSGTYATEIATDPCPSCERTVPRVLGPIIPAAWQPWMALPDGESGPDRLRIDLRGAARVLVTARGVDAWRVELLGSGRGREGDAYVVTVAGRFDADRLVELEDRLRLAVGLAPLQLVVEEEGVVRDRISEAGAPFEDRRS